MEVLQMMVKARVKGTVVKGTVVKETEVTI